MDHSHLFQHPHTTHFPNFHRYPTTSPLVEVAALNNTNGAFTGGSLSTSNSGTPTPQPPLQSADVPFGTFQSFHSAVPTSSAPTFDFSASSAPSEHRRYEEEQKALQRLQQLPRHELQKVADQEELEVRLAAQQRREQEQDFLAAFATQRSRAEPDGDNLSRRSHRSKASSLGSRHSEPAPIDAYITADPEDSLFPTETNAFYNPYSRADAENEEEAQDKSSTTTGVPDLQSKGPSISSSEGTPFRPGNNQFAALRKHRVPVEISLETSRKPPNPTLDAQTRKEEEARDLQQQRYDLNTVSHLRRVVHLRDKIALEIDFSAASLHHNMQEYRHVQRIYAEAGLPVQNFDTWMFKVKKLRKEQAARLFRGTDFGHHGAEEYKAEHTSSATTWRKDYEQRKAAEQADRAANPWYWEKEVVKRPSLATMAARGLQIL